MQNLIERIATHAASTPDKVAVSCDGRTLTYGQLQADAARIAGALVARGLLAGDRAAILAGNSIDYVSAWVGILAARLCVVPLPTMVTPQAITAMLADSGARALFASRETVGLLADWESVAPPDMVRVALGPSMPGWLDGDSFASPLKPPARDREIRPEDAFNIIYSSGTTGLPKGIVHAHALRANSAIAMGSRGFHGEARTLITTALYSNWSMGALIYTLWHGGCASILTRFTVRACLEACVSEKITIIYLVPVQIARILDDPEFDSFSLGSLTCKWCAGSPLPANRKRELLRRWPGGLVEIYGMTEGAPFTLLDADRHPDKLESVGRADPPDDIKIIDDADHEVGANTVGEIVGRTRSVMLGYHNRQPESRAILWLDSQGQAYFRSGDLGRLDGDGFLYVLDRKKDMIISGGFNIYACDIEAVLLTHPMVSEAAVVGIPSDRWGESPAAAVVLRYPGAVTPDELTAWSNARLGKAQRLVRVAMMESLPRGSLDKVLKREVRQRLQSA